MSSVLSTSTSALLAFQRAMATISHNVANVGTDGYSRQRVHLGTREPQAFGSGFIGRGVQQDTVRRMVDDFNFSRMVDSRAEMGRLQQINLLAGRLDRSFTDSASSLARPWSNFFDSMHAVSTDPSSTAAREAMLASAETVAARLRSLQGQLQSYDREVNLRISAGVDKANGLTRELAKLNEEIGRQTGAAGGQPPNDLLDQRDRLVQELAGLLGVTTALQDDGSLNVYTQSGQALVVGTTALRLGTTPDPYRGDRLNIGLELGGTRVPLPSSAIGGELGGLLEVRENVIDATSVALGKIAASLAFNVNRVNGEGIDLYGNPGAAIFNQPALNALPANTNSGTATLDASITDIAAFTGRDVVLQFDGANWSATDRRTGAAVPLTGSGTAGDPLVVDGVSVVVAGTPDANDRFMLQPAAGAAGRIRMVMDDPRGIAAAGPLQLSADIGNLGNAVPRLSIVDRNAAGFNSPVEIEFIDANTYTVNGGPPIAWAPGDTISVNGWEMTLDGEPMAGDVFRVGPTPPGSSDNANMLVMAALDDARLLAGGNGSMNEVLRDMTVSVGFAARHSGDALQAQQAIDQQLLQNRESVSGVNLDEEAANLLRFQQAYQAAAQMITVADTMFQSLLAATRR
jgi:flagellar hook-associated protein 1